MRINNPLVLHPGVGVGLGLVVCVLLIPLSVAGLLVYQTGIYPNAHVVSNNGLNADFVCRVNNCVWELSLSTRTAMVTADSLILVSTWQRNHALRGQASFGPLVVLYRLGDYDSLMCMCPHGYVTFSSLAIAYHH